MTEALPKFEYEDSEDRPSETGGDFELQSEQENDAEKWAERDDLIEFISDRPGVAEKVKKFDEGLEVTEARLIEMQGLLARGEEIESSEINSLLFHLANMEYEIISGDPFDWNVPLWTQARAAKSEHILNEITRIFSGNQETLIRAEEKLVTMEEAEERWKEYDRKAEEGYEFIRNGVIIFSTEMAVIPEILKEGALLSTHRIKRDKPDYSGSFGAGKRDFWRHDHLGLNVCIDTCVHAGSDKLYYEQGSQLESKAYVPIVLPAYKVLKGHYFAEHQYLTGPGEESMGGRGKRDIEIYNKAESGSDELSGEVELGEDFLLIAWTPRHQRFLEAELIDAGFSEDYLKKHIAMFPDAYEKKSNGSRPDKYHIDVVKIMDRVKEVFKASGLMDDSPKEGRLAITKINTEDPWKSHSSGEVILEIVD